MPALLESPLFQALDDDGNPVAGGLLYTYLPGSSTPTPVYHDAGLTTAWTNPVQLDAAGQALIYFGAPIKLTVTDANDVALFTIDPVLAPTTDPAMLESISATVPEYQAQTDPGEVGSESLPSSLEGELERLRYAIWDGHRVLDPSVQYWYETPQAPSVNVKSYGAVGDGVVDDTVAINAAADTLTGGGTLYLPRGTYKVSGQGGFTSCVWVKYDHVRIVGDGYHTCIQTTNHTDTALHISKVQDPASTAGAVIDHVSVWNLRVKGTGTYAYSSLGNGRGIHGCQVAHFSVSDCWVEDMSMIGIDTLQVAGGALISNNHITGCWYTAINFNGRSALGLVLGNVCENCLASGTPNPVVIQVSGGWVIGNQVHNSAGFGILWGEGAGDHIGGVCHNYVHKTTLAGIQAWYSGPVTIQGNTIVNAGPGGEGGIVLVGGTASGVYPLAQHHSLVANNLIINCTTHCISTSAHDTHILNNMCIYLPTVVNFTAAGQPDYLVTGNRAQGGVVIKSAERCVVHGNRFDGMNYGIKCTSNIVTTQWGNNSGVNIQVAEFAWMQTNGAETVNTTLRFLENQGNRDTGILHGCGANIPSTGIWRGAARFHNNNPTTGQPWAWTNTSHRETNTTAPGTATAVLTVASTTGMLAGDIIGIFNAQEFFQGRFTSILTVDSATQLTLNAAQTYVSGEIVYADRWKSLGNVA